MILNRWKEHCVGGTIAICTVQALAYGAESNAKLRAIFVASEGNTNRGLYTAFMVYMFSRAGNVQI